MIFTQNFMTTFETPYFLFYVIGQK